MTKKEHLEIQKIYALQSMSARELEEYFSKIGKDGARLLYLMLRSFQITSRVANAAWGFISKWRTVSVPPVSNELYREIEGMQEALHDYSPANFQKSDSTYEFAATCFEEFYNQAETKQTREEVIELIFEWTCRLRSEAGKKS